MNKVFPVCASVVATFLVSCSSARVVEEMPGRGGIVAIASRDSARGRANRIMSDKCPDGYEIVRESEAVVGAASTPVAVSRATRNVTIGAAATQTRAVTEWRIEFRCTQPNSNATR